jgi:hypothetical protein
MKITRIQEGVDIVVRFRGWVSPALIEFSAITILDQVHANICSIEEARSNNMHEDRNVIWAEIDLLK